MTKPINRSTDYSELPDDWKVIPFEEAFAKQNLKLSKVPTGKFSITGKFPIIDQGKNLISGYTDNDGVLYQGELPVIVFGDHTLSVKYVDFRFAVGADGTKLLFPNKLNFSPKFLYYEILGLNLKSEGYKRHFSKLRKQPLRCPELKEQQKIAEILTTADRKIELIDREIQATEKLKRGLMQTLLTKGIGHTKFKMTEIGERPEEWSIQSIKGCSLPTRNVDPVSAFGIAEFDYIDVSGISSETLSIAETKRIQGIEAPSRARKEIREGDVIFATIRPYLRRVAMVPKNLDGNVCSTAFCVIRADRSTVLPEFLYYSTISENFVNKVSGFQTGSAYPAVSEIQVLSEKIALPALQEQKNLSEIFTTIDKRLQLMRCHKEKFEELKKGLMQALLTGQVRVKVDSSKGEN